MNRPTSPAQHSRIFGWWQLFAIWIPIAAITLVHYLSPSTLMWAHDVLRRLYYIPLIIAAFAGGLRGGLVAASVMTILYLPHAFMSGGHGHLQHDPGRGTEKLLEVLLYFAMGSLVGLLVDRQDRQRRAAEESARELERTLLETRAMEQQVIQAGKLAALGQLTAGVAHEIRNPLHGMRSTAEIVIKALPEGAAEHRMQTLHLAEIDRLNGVIHRFLSFAKPEEPQRRRLDLREVLERGRELADAHSRQLGIQWQFQLPEAPVWVDADMDQVAQVVLNLLLNAFVALNSTTDPTIEVSTHGGADLATVILRNNGPAIPPHLADTLFEPFVTGRPDGTGLGLSTAARIVSNHGGHLKLLDNQEGRVAFSFTLPLET